MGETATTALVSIIIVTHNSQEDIVDCVNSVLNQTFHDFEIIVVDNNSTDDTAEQVRRNFDGNPKVSLVVSKSNTGYAGGNNLGFQHANGKFIVILNPDTVVDGNWLEELLKAYQENETDAGIVCSNVLLFDRKEIINACGNEIHLTGLVFSRFYMESECRCTEGGKMVPAPSGASMFFSKERLRRIGRKDPFDTSRFQMEYSDIDLAIDFLANGFHCYVAFRSRVYHKYKFKMTPERLYTLERGRYEILGHLTRKTQFFLSPALLLTEVIVWIFILSKYREALFSKLRTYGWLLSNAKKIHRDNNSPIKDLELITISTPRIAFYKDIGRTYGKGSPIISEFFRAVQQRLLSNLSNQKTDRR